MMRDIFMTLLWGVTMAINLGACLLLGGLVADHMFGGVDGPHTLLGFIGGIIVWIVPTWLAFELGTGDNFMDHF